MEWSHIKTEHFDVYYKPDVDLKKVERHLRTRGSFYIGSHKLDPLSTIEDKISYRLDRLFEKVEEILDMHPNAFQSNIKIFLCRKELNIQYFDIFQANIDVISFYIKKYSTIYTDEDDVSDSVMAHEMAHAIIGHYFAISPPAKINEMLAQYVDVHLDE